MPVVASMFPHGAAPALLALLTCMAAGAQALTDPATKACGEGVKGHCNACVCCCYKGAVPSYMPDGCQCKAHFGPAFGYMVGIAVATVICSIATSLYFTQNPARPRKHYSPFPIDPTYLSYDERTAAYAAPSNMPPF